MLRGIAWLAFKHSASCIVKVMLALAKGFLNMSIFGSILSAIFHHAKLPRQTPHPLLMLAHSLLLLPLRLRAPFRLLARR